MHMLFRKLPRAREKTERREKEIDFEENDRLHNGGGEEAPIRIQPQFLMSVKAVLWVMLEKITAEKINNDE